MATESASKQYSSALVVWLANNTVDGSIDDQVDGCSVRLLEKTSGQVVKPYLTILFCFHTKTYQKLI